MYTAIEIYYYFSPKHQLDRKDANSCGNLKAK